MKTIKKTILTLCAGIALVISASFGFLTIRDGSTVAKAASDTVTANVQMATGASVRVGESVDTAGDRAIRFQTYIEKDFWANCGEDVETGIYWIPQDLLSGELSNETESAGHVKGELSLDQNTHPTHYVYNYVLYDIPENSYGRDIAARGYVKTADGTYYWADNTQVRSLAYVASAALEDGKFADGTAFSDGDVTCLNAYVDKAVSAFTIADATYSIVEEETQTVSTSITPVYTEDDLSGMKVKYSSDNETVATIENGEIVGKSAGFATITAELGSYKASVLVAVNAEYNDVVLTNDTKGLTFNMPTGYTVKSVTCDGTNWGTSLTALSIPDTVVSDNTAHGEKTLTATVNNGEKDYTVDIPVTLVTGVISTAADWAMVQAQAADSVINGYYVLGADITVSTMASVSVNRGSGFCGTLDGRGHTVSNSNVWGASYGLFGGIGTNAVVKNITLAQTGLNAANNRMFLGMFISAASFTDVTINLTNQVKSSNTSIISSPLCYGGFMDGCTFTNVDINVKNSTIGSLFSGSGGWFTYNVKTFTNTAIYVGADDTTTAFDRIGHANSVNYTAPGLTIDGATVMEGITVYKTETIEATLEDPQYLVMTNTTHSIDLGEYADMEINSITYNGTELGTDPTKLAISEANVQNHGAGKTIVVTGTKNGNAITLNVPIILVTKEISTLSDWTSTIQAQAADGVVYGYYTLKNNINAADTVVGAVKVTDKTDGALGFRGTLDGKGYEFKYTSGANGLFGTIGSGATVKNVTITDMACQPRYEGGDVVSLARLVAGATIENVTINLNNCKKTANQTYGALSYQGFLNCTLNSVTFNIEGTVFSLFGGAKSDYWGLKNMTLTDCMVNLSANATLAEIGHLNATVYTAEGLEKVYAFDDTEVTNATVLSGITVKAVKTLEKTLAYSQEVLTTETTFALELGEYADHTVTSINYGGYDLGNDLTALTLPDDVKTDVQNHGAQTILVNTTYNGDIVKISVPVTLITKAIASADDWAAVQTTADGTATYGYYVLANDVVATMNSVKISASTNGANGFRGTLDGKGYTVSNTNAWGANGIFGAIGNGATIKDVTFEQTGLSAAYTRYFLGQVAFGATFTDVTFNLKNQVTAADNTLSGPLTYDGFVKCTLTNVEFNLVNSTIKTLLGGGSNGTYFGLKDTTFENCNVNILPVGTTTLTEIGHSGNPSATDGSCTVYTAEGLTVEGATVLSGITVNNVTAREVSLKTTQDINLAAETVELNLGVYSDYTVTGISYVANTETIYDLGTTPSALTISEELKADIANHGDNKTISVTAYKGADYVSISVPVTLATGVISTAADWEMVQATAADSVINGYYVLDADITVSTMASVSVNRGSGFCGTLDGRGHTVSNSNAWGASYGLFGGIGTNAVVKNITLSQTGLNAASSRMFIGMFISAASFTDVTINLTNQVKASNTAIISSPLCYGGFTDGCTFTNVAINVANSTIGSLFNGSGGWFTYNAKTFTNTAIYVAVDDTTTAFDYIGTTTITDGVPAATYTAPGLELAGATVMEGITYYSGASAVLLQSGVSPYTIVKPSSSTIRVNEAAEELQYFFKMATGYTLNIITDDGLTHSDTAMYISLGNTALYQSAGITVSDLKEDGSWIKSVDNTIYIVGGGNNDGDGVLYGVYEFLNELFDLEIYYTDCYGYTEKTQIPLTAYDITTNPDIDMRSQTGLLLADSDYANRIRSTDYYWAKLMPVVHAEDSTKADAGHNSLYYLPYTKYGTSNPNFYSNTSTFEANSWGGINAQLCYTGRGDTATYDLMVQLCAERIQASLQQYVENTTYTAVLLGMEDNYYMCECSACQAVVSQYGSISATVIIFLNDVAEAVDAWMEGDGAAYARDLQYMFYAYQQNLAAPTTMPTVTTKIAPLVAFSEMDHSSSPTDTTVRSTQAGSLSNSQILGYMKTWGEWATSNGTGAWAWSYGNFFRDYFCFYDSYGFYGEIFTYLKEYGYVFSYVQQQSDQRGAQSAFMSLNNYVTSKLAWDSSLDMDTLISDYMNAMYADAADEMMAIFENWQALYASELSGLSLGEESPATNLSKSQVDNMFALFDKAYEAIAAYETTDAELYAKLKARIDMEWLAPAKIALVDLKSSYKYFNFGSYKYDDISANFQTIVSELGITAANEFDGIDTILDNL